MLRRDRRDRCNLDSKILKGDQGVLFFFLLTRRNVSGDPFHLARVLYVCTCNSNGMYFYALGLQLC